MLPNQLHLPLWKHCRGALQHQETHHGKVVPAGCIIADPELQGARRLLLDKPLEQAQVATFGSPTHSSGMSWSGSCSLSMCSISAIHASALPRFAASLAVKGQGGSSVSSACSMGGPLAAKHTEESQGHGGSIVRSMSISCHEPRRAAYLQATIDADDGSGTISGCQYGHHWQLFRCTCPGPMGMEAMSPATNPALQGFLHELLLRMSGCSRQHCGGSVVGATSFPPGALQAPPASLPRA